MLRDGNCGPKISLPPCADFAAKGGSKRDGTGVVNLSATTSWDTSSRLARCDSQPSRRRAFKRRALQTSWRTMAVKNCRPRATARASRVVRNVRRASASRARRLTMCHAMQRASHPSRCTARRELIPRCLVEIEASPTAEDSLEVAAAALEKKLPHAGIFLRAAVGMDIFAARRCYGSRPAAHKQARCNSVTTPGISMARTS
jgi:hypothetical protein